MARISRIEWIGHFPIREIREIRGHSDLVAALPRWVIRGQSSSIHMLRRQGRAASEFHRELTGHELLALLHGTLLMIVAVLQLGLEMASKAVAEGSIGAPGVLVPPLVSSRSVPHFAKELLVPAHGCEKTRRDLVLGF
jgi:hypothetical protein